VKKSDIYQGCMAASYIPGRNRPLLALPATSSQQPAAVSEANFI